MPGWSGREQSSETAELVKKVSACTASRVWAQEPGKVGSGMKRTREMT
jgi:hypothetical protein